MKASLWAIVFAFVIFSGQAFAACYSNEEIEAEQALRIHSELMVIGLNCQHMIHDKGNLYILYREFTRKHGSLIRGYEQKLINFYSRQGYSNPEGQLHNLRTKLANAVSQDVARTRPDLFCRRYADRIPQAMQMSGGDVKRWAATSFPGKMLSQPTCATASR